MAFITPEFGPAMAEIVLGIGLCMVLVADLYISDRARDITYLHVLQPTLHDEGSKPLTDDERRTGKAPEVWESAARSGYPLLREAGAKLREQGVAFHDGSSTFATLEEQVYYDACHFRKPGHDVLADSVARALLDTLSE